MLLATVFAMGACAPLPPASTAARHAPARTPDPPPEAEPAPIEPAHQITYWSLSELAAVNASAVEISHDDRLLWIFPVSAFRALTAAAGRITRAAYGDPPATEPVFVLEPGWAPNAFAIARRAGPMVAVNFGMVALIGDDEGMWATVLGHELAHFVLQHQQRRSERIDWGSKASGVFTVLLGFIGVPLAPLLTDTAAAVVSRGYSREDEREADRLAVTYLRQAGYDPADALRFHEHLASHSGSRDAGTSLMSTHPGGRERVEAMRRLIEAPAGQ